MDVTDEVVREGLRWDFTGQLAQTLKVRVKSGELRRVKANIHQRRIDNVVKAAHSMKRPCRIIALKPRQKGSSTGSVGIGHVRAKAKPMRGLMAGGKHFQGENLFRMLRTYVENDELDPKSAKPMDMEFRYHNGSTVQRITLASGDAGRSGTYQFLLVTEAAYLANEGVANADVVMDGLLKCVPLEPDTIIIQESTANGAAGMFYETWQGAITFEEFLAGKNGYVKVFSAWFEFEDSRLNPASEGIRSEDDLTEWEREYAEKWALDLWQVAWMRYAIREECRGDLDKFMQDYPSDDRTAFLTSGRCVFDDAGMTYQERVSKERPYQWGLLKHVEDRDVVVWQQTSENQARCVMWESPRVGLSYLVVVDSASGEDQTGGDDPDSHAVFVLRAGYWGERGKWVEPAVVMSNVLVPGYKPGSVCCWWANDVLTEEVWRMARFYQAIVVPEENHDRGLIELLKQRGDVEIYRREIFNRREQSRTMAYGWQTTVKTRPMIIETLAAAVRESGKGEPGKGFEVRDWWGLREMRNFGTKPNGRMEALVGHDDRVLALAIGIQCIGSATPYLEKTIERWIPPDLRGVEFGRRGGRVRAGMS
jgi:hypothetical protein